MMILVAWHPDMDVRCGVRTARLPGGVQGTVLYEGSYVRTAVVSERFCFTCLEIVVSSWRRTSVHRHHQNIARRPKKQTRR